MAERTARPHDQALTLRAMNRFAAGEETGRATPDMEHEAAGLAHAAARFRLAAPLPGAAPEVARAAPVGRFCGWKSLMPVTMWTVVKGEAE